MKYGLRSVLRSMFGTRSLKPAALGAMLALLSACGGGSDGESGFLPDDPNAGLTRYNLTLALLDADGNPVTTVTPGRTAILTAEVREANSLAAAVEGVIVTTAVEFAVLSPENGAAVTDQNGIATFEVSGGAIRGADLAQVSVESPAGAITSSIAFQIEDVALEFDVTLLDSDGLETTFIAPGRPGTLEVLVSQRNPDGSRTPPSAPLVVNATAEFATIRPENGAALTNAEGLATFQLLSGETSGADTVLLTVASASGDEFNTTFPLQIFNDADGFSISLALINGSGSVTNQIDAGSPGTLRALLTRSNPLLGIDGEPVVGQILSAVSTDGEITPANGDTLTDQTGTASFGLAVGASLGAQTATVSVNGPNGAVNATLPYEVVNDVEGSGFAALFLELQLRNSAGQPITRFERGESGFVRVRVLGRRDGSQARVLVPGIPVSITAANGLVTPASGNLISDSSGEANFLIEAGDVSGTDVITATLLGPSGPVSEALAYDVTGEVLLFTTVLLDAAGNQSSFVVPGQSATLRVTVRQQNPDGSQSIPNGPVVVSAAGSVAVISPDNGSVVTNGAGVAEFRLTSGDLSGADLIAISAESQGGETFTDNFPLQVVAADDDFTLTLTLVNSAGAPVTQIDPTAPGTLIARLTRSNSALGVSNQPVARQLVRASLSNDGSITPSNGAALTNSAGEAVFGIGAGTTIGAETVTVTLDGPEGTLSQDLAYQIVEEVDGGDGGGLALGLSLRLLDSNAAQSSQLSQSEPLTLEVRVTDSNGVPSAGIIVEAVTDVALLAPANGRALTNASGIALFTLSAGNQSGAGTVIVTASSGGSTAERSINYQVFQLLFDLALSLVDANDNPTTQVTTSQPATLRVQTISLNVPAQPVSGFVVTATGGLVEISPSSGTSLTDGTGVAEFVLSAGDVEGADLLTVTLETGTGSISESIGVQVNVGGLNFGGFIDGTFTPDEIGFTVTELAYGGRTRLNLAVVDDSGELVVNANEVRLTSDCSIRGEAVFRRVSEAGVGESALVVPTVQGLAAAEYNTITCEGEDEIRATLIGENLTATGTVTIAPLSANYVGFVEADPAEGPESGDRTVIALAGTGGAPAGRPEVARVTFEVLASRPADNDPRPGDPAYIDRADRVPLPNALVTFELTNDLAGIELCDPSGSCVTFGTLSLSTDQDGLAVVEVRSGNVPAQTFVIASYTDPDSGSTVTSASNQVIISTGLPDQNSLSLSVEGGFYVANAANVDGVERVITARLADRFNNPVPDGTAVIFRTEYGSIDSTCETGQANGSRLVERGDSVPSRGLCSVLWTSQAPRFPDNLPSTGEEVVTVFDNNYACPSHNGVAGPCPNDLGSVRGLRSSILAYVIGEEDFADSNANGLYDVGETFSNCEEAFIDFNEDGAYTDTFFEEFIDNDNDNMYGDGGLINGAGAPVYNGTLCTEANESAGVCSRDLINVRGGKLGCAVPAGLPQPSALVLTLSSVPGNQLATLERTADDTVLAPGSTLDLAVAHAVHIADRFNNRPGNGTSITFELDDTEACALLVEGNFIGGDNPASVTLTIDDGGDAPGATTISPIVVTNELDAVGGTVLVSVEGVFLTSFSCN